MKLLLLALSAGLLLGGCCRKVMCNSAMIIELRNFTTEELSEIYIISSLNNDTTRAGQSYPVDTSNYRVSTLGISSEHPEDFTIYVPKANKTFAFTDLKYENRTCSASQCLWNKDTYQQFVGCKVNGQDHGQEINLYRDQ